MKSLSFKYTIFEERGEIGILILNRKDKLNAIDLHFMEELSLRLDYLEKSHLKALVVTSSIEDVFAAGGDISYFLTLSDAEKAKLMAFKMHTILNRFEDLEIPTICAINGSAIGGGAELVVAFDVCFMRNDSFIQFKEKEIGVTTGWGGTYRLVRRVGYSGALRLLLSAEKVDAKRARELGLVDDIYDKDIVVEKAIEFCESFSGDDLRLIKHIKRLARFSVFSSREEYMELERKLFSESWMFGKREEMMRRFVSKDR